MTSMFGRRYRVRVLKDPDDGENDGQSATLLTVSDSNWEPESLRVVFDINLLANYAVSYGDVSIFNLNTQTQNDLIQEGCVVQVEAGYQNGHYGNIFTGRVMQVLYEHRNVTDFVTTLHCLWGYKQLVHEFVNFSVGPNMSVQRDLIAQMSRNSRTQFGDTVVGDLQTKSLPRGKGFFGHPRKYLQQIAEDNSMQWWFSEDLEKGIMTMVDLTKPSSRDPIVVSPETGLIGYPQQWQNGVNLTVQLDPRFTVMAPPMTVKMTSNTAIRQIPTVQQNYVRPLDKDFIYNIGGVRHVGDTRGQQWETQICGWMAGDSYLGNNS